VLYCEQYQNLEPKSQIYAKIEDMITSIGVFCGSSSGHNRSFFEAAVELGHLLAREQIRLVYGGGRTGLMGVIADATLEHGGEVMGVIPKSLVEREVAHQNLSELHVVNTMFERKRLMLESSDAFIAMPGGFGTLDEIFESITLAQIGEQLKPSGFLNVQGYFEPILEFVDNAVIEGLIQPHHRGLMVHDDQPARLLERLRNWSV
jgi:uncharacterized protein (TIGR00730 family)